MMKETQSHELQKGGGMAEDSDEESQKGENPRPRRVIEDDDSQEDDEDSMFDILEVWDDEEKHRHGRR